MKKLILCCIALFSISTHAWNAVGHRVVANIAYERLQPDVRTKIDKMVADLGKEYSSIQSFSDLGPWPDTLRSQKIETFTHWHYIDIPFSDDGTPLKNIIDTDNVIWAINKIEPIVQNSKANPYERARFLAFLVHVIADIHQPLHTTARISAAHPDGDLGGNLFFIKTPAGNHSTITLHKYWDDGLDVFNVSATPDVIARLSHEITTAYPEDFFGDKLNDLKPEIWGNEGLALSEAYVYSTNENEIPNAQYINNGKELVKQQAALAGYRLARVLNQLILNSSLKTQCHGKNCSLS